MEYKKAIRKYPSVDSQESYKEYLKFAKKLNETNKTNNGYSVEEIDEYVLRNVAMFSSASISPMAAFFGGIVA
jgi:hypothetical protein